MANPLAARAFGALSRLAARKDFLGGLAAPIPKVFGGMQRLYGRGLQGAAAVSQGLGSSADDLLKNPMFQRGAQHVSSGNVFRQQAGLRAGLSAPNPLKYRVGRGIGAVALGAPIATAPFTLAEYAGASSADPALAEEYAKNMAYDRSRDRLEQFKSMNFLDRMRTAYDPQSFTQKLNMPEATNLYQAMSDNNLNNPGIMKYISSFNPFTGSADEVINQKVRSEMMRSMQNKSANEKQANLGQVLKGLGAAWKLGRGAATSGAVKGMKSIPVSGAKPPTNIPIWEAALQKGMYNIGKSPGTAAFGIGGAAIAPYFLGASYNSGRNAVYDAAANNAMGMADLQLLEKFNQPGFMGGLGRAGMAIAPGMGSDMILNRIRQSMFPEVNQQQY